MYCKNCGQFLTGNENFCSNCGTKVEPPVMPKAGSSIGIGSIMDAAKEDEASAGANVEQKKESIKIISPIDDMVWDVKEFPSGEPRKTEDTNIRWRSDDMFLHKEIQREQKAFEESMAQFVKEQDGKSVAQQEGSLEVPDIFKDSYNKDSQSKDNNGKDDTIEIDRTVITRNTRPVEPIGENDEHIVEIEQPIQNGIALEVTESENEGVKVEKVMVDEPQMTSVIATPEEPIENVAEATTKTAAESVTAYEKTALTQEDVLSEAEKPSTLFDEIAPSAVATLQGATINEEKKQIDKFYTFNRKKEEFQKLLDKEYERIENKMEPGGFEDDIAGFMDVERGTAVEGTTQLEEMVKARTLFFDDPFYIPPEDNSNETVTYEGAAADIAVAEPEETEAVIDDEDTGIPVQELEPDRGKVVFEPEQEESLADVLVEQEAENSDAEASEPEQVTAAEKETDAISETTMASEGENAAAVEKESSETATEKEAAAEADTIKEAVEDDTKEDSHKEKPTDAQIVIEPGKKSDDKADQDETEKLAKAFFEDDDEEEKQRMGKGSKVLIWILSIIIVITAALLVIRIAMPNTAISRQMDKVANSVISLFTGGDEEPASPTADNGTRGQLQEDKTGLIQLQIGKNYKDAIGTIKYNSAAAYNSEASYSAAGLDEAKDIQTNLWYKDSAGNEHYYDEELVGAIIAFESERVAYANEDDQKVMEMVGSGGNIKSMLTLDAGSDAKMTFSQLDIGDIKVAGNSYFVWVIETINGQQLNKIYEFKEQDQALVVTSSYDA